MCFVYNFLKFDMTCWSMGCKIDVVFAGRNFILMKLNSASKSSSKPGGCPVSNVNNPVGLACLPYAMWSAHFFVIHIQTEKISSWNGPTVHICCFMLAESIFVRRVRKTAEKIFVSRKIR